MDTTPNDLNHLFCQLGLESTPGAIEQFLSRHKLSGLQKLEEAPFWNTGQQAFLREEKRQDAAWSESIDLLDTLLR